MCCLPMKSLTDFFQGFSSNPAKQTVVGIDVGSSSIKVVQLEEQKGVLTLTTYGEIQLGPYGQKDIGQAVALSASKEQEALVDVLRESAVVAKDAVFAMPLASSFVTNTIIEADEKADISLLVRVEARKVIPISLNEVTLDWAEMELADQEKSKDDLNKREILIAAIQNSALERFRTLMQFTGLAVPPTEIECFSAIRALHTKDDEDMAIIDIGATSTKLYVAKKGLLMRMHRIRVGGVTATNRIASVLNIEFEAAEIKKREVQKTDPDYGDIKRAHDTSFDRAFKELNQVLQEYETKDGTKIKSVYLTGGATLFPGIETVLRDTLNKDVIRTNAFAKVSYPAFMQDTVKEIAPSFTVALGAALRAFE
jgi:type IV pilus assembly protein PilM